MVVDPTSEEYDEYMDDIDLPEDVDMIGSITEKGSFQLDLDALLMYYQNFFPSKELCQWLSFGNGIL